MNARAAPDDPWAAWAPRTSAATPMSCSRSPSAASGRYGGSQATSARTSSGRRAASTFVPFALAADDVGVRSIQGVTLGTSYGGGAIHLVAYRVIARGSVMAAGGSFALDAFQLGMPRIYDDSVMSLLWLPSATTAATIQGSIGWSQG